MEILAWVVLVILGGGILVRLFALEPLGTLLSILFTAAFAWALMTVLT